MLKIKYFGGSRRTLLACVMTATVGAAGSALATHEADRFYPVPGTALMVPYECLDPVTGQFLLTPENVELCSQFATAALPQRFFDGGETQGVGPGPGAGPGPGPGPDPEGPITGGNDTPTNGNDTPTNGDVASDFPGRGIGVGGIPASTSGNFPSEGDFTGVGPDDDDRGPNGDGPSGGPGGGGN
jgi:hypothetical protein